MKTSIAALPGILLLTGCSFFQPDEAVHRLNSKGEYPTRDQINMIYEHTKFFPEHTEISLAIIKNDTPHFYGVRRKNDTLKTVVNQQSVFEIGSITKLFTSTVLARLILDSLVNLDDPIQKHLDISLKTDVPITLKNLSNHTSGLPRLPSNLELLSLDSENPYKNYGREELNSYLTEELELENQPGDSFEYSNLGAGLLGCLLADNQKTTLNRLYQNMIFSKYGMTRSSADDHNPDDTLVPGGLDMFGNQTTNWDFDAMAGAGAIRSTTEDLSKFVSAHFNGDDGALKLTRQPTFTNSENMQVGLGWIISTKNNATRYWHNGATGGYHSIILMEPDNQNAIIILSRDLGYKII